LTTKIVQRDPRNSISGEHLPGIRFGEHQGALENTEPVYLGIQKRDEVQNLIPGSASPAVFDLTVDVVLDSGDEGVLDFRGQFVHGTRGKRFLYLSWGVLGKKT
jgi:Family of unknown function (DUF5990)